MRHHPQRSPDTIGRTVPSIESLLSIAHFGFFSFAMVVVMHSVEHFHPLLHPGLGELNIFQHQTAYVRRPDIFHPAPSCLGPFDIAPYVSFSD